MAQNGFAIFFMLLIVGSAYVLALTLAESWTRILRVARGPDAAEDAAKPVYTTMRRRPEDLPSVARRLDLRRDASPRRAAGSGGRAPLTSRQQRRTSEQLTFEYA